MVRTSGLHHSSPDQLRFEQRTRYAALVLLGFFVVMSILVQTQMVHGLDVAVAEEKSRHLSEAMRTWSEVVAILFSAEFSVLYAGLGFLLLLFKGLRAWALAPAGFLLGLIVEVVMKSFLHQPGLPDQFKLSSHYPLTIVDFPGSYPSGHAMRVAFFLVFLAVIAWRRGGLAGKATAGVLVVLSLAAAFTRIYMGFHWTSDVVAGLALGAAIALLVAPPLLGRLDTTRP